MRYVFRRDPVIRGTREADRALRPVAKIGVEQSITRTRVFDFSRAKAPERVVVHLPAVDPNPIKNYQPTSLASGEFVDREKFYRGSLIGKINKHHSMFLGRMKGKKDKDKDKKTKTHGRVAKHNPSFGIAEKGDVSVDKVPGNVLDKFFDAINNFFKVKK